MVVTLGVTDKGLVEVCVLGGLNQVKLGTALEAVKMAGFPLHTVVVEVAILKLATGKTITATVRV